MRSLQLSRQFDGLLAWDSFFHLRPDDQRRMFNVFARHAAPSTVLMFNTGPTYGESVGEYRGDLLYHASLSPEEYTTLLTSIGFQVVVHGQRIGRPAAAVHGLAHTSFRRSRPRCLNETRSTYEKTGLPWLPGVPCFFIS